MLPEVQRFLEVFNAVVQDAERFCYFARGVEFQRAAVPKLEQLVRDAESLKKELASRGEEDAANFVLGIVCVAKAVEQELRMFVTLKADTPDTAWNHLISAQSHVSTAVKAHDSFTYLENYADKLDAQEKLFFPAQTFFSPGFIIRQSRCSICEEDYGECEHVKGKAYAGELCVRIIERAELLEGSIVKEPANKCARVYSYSDKDGDRDIMTWRIRSKVTEKHEDSGGSQKASSGMLIIPAGAAAEGRDSTLLAPKSIVSIEPWLKRKPPPDPARSEV